jgi:hypothetical protein
MASLTNYSIDAAKAPMPMRETFMGPVEEAAKRMEVVTSRLSELADRLCGSIPANEGESNMREVPNGVFDTVADYARTMVALANRADSEIARITRALP